jgi:hypothetical protein
VFYRARGHNAYSEDPPEQRPDTFKSGLCQDEGAAWVNLITAHRHHAS